MLIVGDDEASTETVSVRPRSGKERRDVAVGDFADTIVAEIQARKLDPSY